MTGRRVFCCAVTAASGTDIAAQQRGAVVDYCRCYRRGPKLRRRGMRLLWQQQQVQDAGRDQRRNLHLLRQLLPTRTSAGCCNAGLLLS